MTAVNVGSASAVSAIASATAANSAAVTNSVIRSRGVSRRPTAGCLRSSSNSARSAADLTRRLTELETCGGLSAAPTAWSIA